MDAHYNCSRAHQGFFSNNVEVSDYEGSELEVKQDDYLSPVIFAYSEECGHVSQWEIDPEASNKDGLWDLPWFYQCV